MSKSPLSYDYYHAPIPGGGYVTGFVFDPEEKGILYCRTDIGGTYRYSYEDKNWHSLIEHVGMEDLSETFPIAIAAHKGRLYIACGDGRHAPWNPDPDMELEPCGRLCISGDKGESFVYEDIPCYIHGNLSGRGTGKRMVVTESGRIFFASQRDGLGIRDVNGKWEFKPVCGEKFLTLVWLSKDEKTVIVGSAGVSNREGEHRGHSLYISTDGGETFTGLKEPEDPKDERYSGVVAQRIAADDKYLYVSFSCNRFFSFAGWMGYSCDGGEMRDGKLARYSLSDISGTYEDITPRLKEGPLGHGLSGLAASQMKPGFICVSAIGDHSGDTIWVSYDHGDNWDVALRGMETGNLSFRAPYLSAKNHGGHSPVHWMSDLGLNPHDPDELWFNTGTGVFLSEDFTKKDRHFCDHCDGIEETVHLNLYSPPSGEVQLIDILGDLGGFAFRDLKKPCDNSFADENHNRYITCINADFPDADPEKILVTARGNWTGLTKGGMIFSTDNAKSWRRLPLPFGIDKELDRICENIEKPNVNPGWAALSADAKTFVFTAAEGIVLKRRNTVFGEFKEDGSVRYSAVKINDPDPPEEQTDPLMKVFSDRTDPSYFYGFGGNSRLYVSCDGGRSFTEKRSPLPDGIQFGLIDCADGTEIRGDAGYSGRFYIALKGHGLWLLTYDKESDIFRAERLTKDGDTVFRCGLGILKDKYIGEDKMIYICGIVDGHYGFYRSADAGKSWQLLNDDKHRFGEVISIEGDSRYNGRFFIASGSLGVIVGEETK